MATATSIARRGIILLVVAILSMAVLFPGAAAYAASGSGSGDVDNGSLSFAKVSEAASIYIDNLFATNNIDKLGGISADTAGNAGAGLGYVADDSQLAVENGGNYRFHFLNPKSSDATVVYNYSAYSNYGNADQVKGFQGYVLYGKLLRDLGLDETWSANPPFIRMIGGAALYGSWWLANLSRDVLAMVYHGLSYLNPLALFKTSGVAANSNEWEGSSNTLLGNSDSLTSTFGGVLDAALRIGKFVAVPLLLALFIFMVTVGKTLFQSKWNWTRARNLGVRMAFLVFGIPAMMVCFGWAASTMGNMFLTSSGTGVAAGAASSGQEVKYSTFESSTYDYVILQTLVDFEDWAANTNLKPPSGVTLELHATTTDDAGAFKASSYDPTSDSIKDIRATALRINAMSNKSLSSVKALNDSALQSVVGANGNVYSAWAPPKISDPDGMMKSTAEAMLKSYMTGEVYKPGDYEGNAKARLANDTSGDKARDEMEAWFRAAAMPSNYASHFTKSNDMSSGGQDGKSWSDRKGEDNGVFDPSKGIKKNLSTGKQEYGEDLADLFKKLRDGEITLDEYNTKVEELLDIEEGNATTGSGGQGTVDKTFQAVNWFTDGSLKASEGADSVKFSADGPFGLSTVSMYNYLSTNFTDSGATVYSNDSVTEQAVYRHASVSAVGSGVYGILSVVNAILFLLAIGILGFVYGIGLLFTVLKNGFALILNIPFAAMGWLRGIARAILLFLGMIVEMFVCGYLYIFMAEVLGLLPGIMTSLGSAADGLLRSITGGALSTSAASTLALVIGCVLLLLFIVMSIRMRAMILGALNGILSSLTEKIVGATGGSISASDPVGSFVKGAGAAAPAMAAGAVALGASGAANGIFGGGEGGAGGDASSGSKSKGGSGSMFGQLNGSSESSAELTGGTNADTPPDQGIENENRQDSGITDASSTAQVDQGGGWYNTENGYDRSFAGTGGGKFGNAEGGDAEGGDATAGGAEMQGGSTNASVAANSASKAVSDGGLGGKGGDAATSANFDADLNAEGGDGTAHAGNQNMNAMYDDMSGMNMNAAMMQQAAFNPLTAQDVRGDADGYANGADANANASADSNADDAHQYTMQENGEAGYNTAAAHVEAGAENTTGDIRNVIDGTNANVGGVNANAYGSGNGEGGKGEGYGDATSQAVAEGGNMGDMQQNAEYKMDGDMANSDAYSTSSSDAASQAENLYADSADRNVDAAIANDSQMDAQVESDANVGDVNAFGGGSERNISDAYHEIGGGEGGQGGQGGQGSSEQSNLSEYAQQYEQGSSGSYEGGYTTAPDTSGGGTMEHSGGHHHGISGTMLGGIAASKAAGGSEFSSGTKSNTNESVLNRPNASGVTPSRTPRPQVKSAQERLMAASRHVPQGGAPQSYSSRPAGIPSRPYPTQEHSPNAPVTHREPGADGPINV